MQKATERSSAITLAKATPKKVGARVKAEAIDGLYDNMETSE